MIKEKNKLSRILFCIYKAVLYACSFLRIYKRSCNPLGNGKHSTNEEYMAYYKKYGGYKSYGPFRVFVFNWSKLNPFNICGVFADASMEYGYSNSNQQDRSQYQKIRKVVE